jgi:hypothetical protein
LEGLALKALREDVLPKNTARIAAGEDVERAVTKADDESLEWAVRFHLVESPDHFRWSFVYSWLRRAVWQILRYWAEDPSAASRLGLPELRLRYEWHEKVVTDQEFLEQFFATEGVAAPEPDYYQLRCPKWDPLRQGRTEAKEAILAGLAEQLDPLLDREEARCEAARLGRAAKRAAVEHFDWTILYQVKGLRYGQIAKSECRSHQTVAGGVKDVAKLVIGPGWKQWLRRGRPGRPPTG